MSRHITFQSLAHRMPEPRRRSRSKASSPPLPLVAVGIGGALAFALWHLLRTPTASAASSPR